MTNKDKDGLVILIRGIAGGFIFAGVAGLALTASVVSLVLIGIGLVFIALQTKVNGEN